jgi:hypothetical protein
MFPGDVDCSFLHCEIDQQVENRLSTWGEVRSASEDSRSFRFEGQMGFAKAPWQFEPALGAPRLADPPFPNHPLMNFDLYQGLCAPRASRSAQ